MQTARCFFNILNGRYFAEIADRFGRLHYVTIPPALGNANTIFPYRRDGAARQTQFPSNVALALASLDLLYDLHLLLDRECQPLTTLRQFSLWFFFFLDFSLWGGEHFSALLLFLSFFRLVAFFFVFLFSFFFGPKNLMDSRFFVRVLAAFFFSLIHAFSSLCDSVHFHALFTFFFFNLRTRHSSFLSFSLFQSCSSKKNYETIFSFS